MSCKDLKAGELVPRTTILPPSPTRPHPHAPVMAFVFVPPLDGEFPESRASFLHAPPPHPPPQHTQQKPLPFSQQMLGARPSAGPGAVQRRQLVVRLL